ncbi:MAG: TonB-dependent receptor, partial [Chlorobi bacterium]|nr:TonB-dependent receptor [Chlorobiota bacterium]
MSFAAKRLPITTLTLVFILVAPIVAVAQATLRGKVVEHSTGQPIGYVTISLFRSGDTTQRASAGALSLPDGSFVIRSVREGLYRLRVRMIGYAVVERDSIAVPSSGTVTLGTISLRQEAIEQRAVEVRAERELQESRPDRRIYRVGKDLTVAGGTAADALQNVPGVTVDQDRSIQLRGSSNVVVLLDGKPTALTGGDRSGGTGLDNIPADAIEAIEIVTTPDARYDAEGGAGIVNIILKRQRQQPLTAFGTVTVGTRDKYSGFASIGVQTSALRGEGSYGWTRQTFDFDRYSLLVPHVETAGPDYPGRVTGSRPVRSETHTPRLNLDADLFDGAGRMTVTVGGTFQQQRTVSDASYVYLLRQQNGTDPVLSGRTEYRTMYRGDTTTGIEASVGYRHRFDDQWSLSTDARTLQTRTVAGAFGTMLVLSDGIAATNRMGSSQMIQQHSLQADATYRFPNRGQFDVGAKITWRHLDADQRTVADSTDPLAAVLTVAVSGAVAERIAAAYVQTMLPIGVLQLSAGLRAEATDFRSSIGSVDFRQSYWNLFPSLNAMYSPDPLLRLSLRYSRRISRPSNEALSPLVQQDDPYNLRTGTPALQPELVDALELGATAVLPWATIAPTFYWRSHQNVL